MRDVIAISASNGGTDAVLKLLQKLPPDMPPILINMQCGSMARAFAELLDAKCALKVALGQGGREAEPGMAFVAPSDEHMTLASRDGGYFINLSKSPPVGGFRPSADVLFDSVADCAGKNAIGVILTGLGNDGAKGLLRMRQCGAYTIGQDEASSVVYGAAKSARFLGAVEQEASLDDIPKKLLSLLGRT